MPLNTRGIMKRKVDEAINHIKGAQQDLAELHVVYEGTHPEIAEVFTVTIAGLELMLPVLEKQRDAI